VENYQQNEEKSELSQSQFVKHYISLL